MTNWPVKTLGDLMTVQNGYAFDSEYFSLNGKIGLIRIRDLKNGIATETHFDGPYDDQYVVTNGDYLIGMDGEFRCYEWKGAPALLNQRVCRLRDFGKSLDARFLFYGINKFLKEIEDVTGYTTVKHLSSKSILAIEMPVPPLDEQKRIVALLDAATARVNELTACYEQARTHANNLFTSALRDALESNPDWSFKTLGSLLEVSIGGIWGSEAGEDDVDVFVYRSTELIKDGQLKQELTVRRSITARQLDSRKLEEGDLLLEKSGGGPKTPVGRVGLVKVLPGLSVCSNFMQLMRPRKAEVLPVFLHYFLTHFHVAGYTEELQNNSTNIRNLKTSEYLEIEIPLPSLEEQKQIVAQLDSMRAKTSEMVAAYDAKLSAAMNLRQSILESAFAGDL